MNFKLLTLACRLYVNSLFLAPALALFTSPLAVTQPQWTSLSSLTMGLFSCLYASTHSVASAWNILFFFFFPLISFTRSWLSLHFLWEPPSQCTLILWPSPDLALESVSGQRIRPCVPRAVLDTEDLCAWVTTKALKRNLSHLVLLNYSVLARIKQL